MSVAIDMQTPNKQQLAQVLKAIADMIATSGNDTVTVNLTVTFNPPKREAPCLSEGKAQK